MDIKTLERQAKNNELVKKLPLWAWVADATSSKIWWVLYPEQIPHQTNLASHFVMGIADNNSSLLYRSYNKEIGKILNSTGRALEYFFIDHLQRNKHNGTIAWRISKINHRKWTFEQDTQDKVDFITTISVDTKAWVKHITSWIQLTTADSPEYKPQSPQNTEQFQQKKHIAKTSSMQREYIPRSYQPNIKWFMVVNGDIQKSIHQHKSKIFSKSFRKWRKDQFSYGWPGKFLPENFSQELKKVAALYERSQYHMIENYILDPKKKKKTHVIQEHESSYIHIKHDERTDELIYEFFNKQGQNQNYNFTASISYFLPKI